MEPLPSPSDKERETVEENISLHIFTASSALVGVCLTVIGLFRTVGPLVSIRTVCDDLLALNALIFLAATFLSYSGMRTRRATKRRRLERIADFCFLLGLTAMAVVCFLIVYELAIFSRGAKGSG